MKKIKFSLLPLAVILFSIFSCQNSGIESNDSFSEEILKNKLISWNDGVAKNTIQEFVQKTTNPQSPDFIPEKDRIAVFDNDGTLWAEKPYYFQLDYALFFIKKEASKHPEWNENELIQAVLADDMKTIMASGEHGLIELVMYSHSGMSEDEFSSHVREWLNEAKHPQTGMKFTDMVYQPMLELLDYLRSHGYKTFIVSGGGIDFLRVWAEQVYGIPPYQVVGSSIKAAFQEVNGKNVIVKIPELNLINDKAGKPVGIHQYIGKRPVMAFGNSDGDFQMLEYTTSGKGPRLGVYIHHTDAEREFAYDSLSSIGNLKRGLIEAPIRNWLVVDMAKDWSLIYPTK